MSWSLNIASVYSMLRRLVYCVSDHVAKTLSFKTTPNTTWFTLRVTTQYIVKRVLIFTQLCCGIPITVFSHNFQPLYGNFLGLHALTKTCNINYNTSACVFTYQQNKSVDGGGGVRDLIAPLNQITMAAALLGRHGTASVLLSATHFTGHSRIL